MEYRNGCEFCIVHALALADAVAQRGWARWCAKLGGSPAVRDRDGKTWDPLALAETTIYAKAFRVLGLRAWEANPEGTARCYLCEADRRAQRDGRAAEVVKLALDAVAEFARREGFIERTREFTFTLVGAGG